MVHWPCWRPPASRSIAWFFAIAVPALGVSASAHGQSESRQQGDASGSAVKTEPAGDEAPTSTPETGVEPDSDPRVRARHSEPAIFRPPPESRPRDVLFPAVLRPLQPYLQLANRFGTRSVRPGALIEPDPVSDAVQWAKTELAKVGVRYSFDQTLVGSSMSDRVKGNSVIGAYAYSFFGNWTIFEADELGGTCGWLSAKVVGDFGLGVDLDDQSVRANIGAVSSPNNNYRHNPIAAQELAWAQAFADGELVVLAGLINQTNYLDINKYANSAHGQFLNSSLVNSQVLPAPSNNLGLNFQWQPVDSFYAMLGLGPNNQALGQNPTHDVSNDSFSYVGELGLICRISGVWGRGPFACSRSRPRSTGRVVTASR